MLRRGATEIAALALAAGCLCAFPAASVASAERSDARLDRALRAIVKMPEGPVGVSALVQRGKRAELHAAGRANLLRPGRIKAHQRMRIASVTKAFTGAVLLRLVEQGGIKPGSTVGSLLPELDPRWHPITLRQLALHTSGLPNYTDTPAFQAYFPVHPRDHLSPEQILAFAESVDVEFPAGTRYEYSNTDNIVMALMAERVTGRPFKKLLSGLVLRPLRLRETTFSPRIEMPRPFIRGYLFDDDDGYLDLSEVFSPSGTWAAGMIVSTPRELNRFMRAWAGGKLLRTAAGRRLQTAFLPPFTGGQPPGPGQNRGGWTLYRYSTPCGVILGHSGNFPGYTQWAASTPDGSRSAVVTANVALSPPSNGNQEVFRALRDIYQRAACSALAS